MSQIHKVIILLLPEPNTEYGASELEGVKSVQDFPSPQTCKPVALSCVVRICRRFLLQVDTVLALVSNFRVEHFRLQ